MQLLHIVNEIKDYYQTDNINLDDYIILTTEERRKEAYNYLKKLDKNLYQNMLILKIMKKIVMKMKD